MEEVDIIDNELNGFEQHLAMQLEHYAPDNIFVQDLKHRLVSSKVFELRREISAIVVACLALLLTGALAFSLCQFIHQAKRSISK